MRSSAARIISYFNEETRERFVPYVIEPAAGADRATLAFLVDAYDEDEAEGETRVVLRFHPRLAPVKAAVLPLLRKDGQPEKAQRGARPPGARTSRCSTIKPARSAGAIGGRTRSARRSESLSIIRRCKTTRSRFAIATRCSKSACRSTACWMN